MSPDLALAYCRMIARTLDVDANGLTRLLRGTGIDIECFYDSDGFVDWSGAKRLIRNAAAMDSRPGFALRVGARVPPMAHGSIGMAIMVSATLRDAMHLFARYSNTRTRVFSTEVSEDTKRIGMRLEFAFPFDDNIRFLTDVALASAYTCQTVLCGEQVDDSRVYFNYPTPKNTLVYQQVFAGAELVFNARVAGVSIPIINAERVLPGHNAGLLHTAIEQCESHLRELSCKAKFSDRVITALSQQQGLPSAQACAAMLHLSSRTLIRRLKKEGVSFQQLRDQWLARRALQLLSTPNYTVTAVSEELGYTDVASFRRAFKRWFDTSPQIFRQSLK